MEFIATPGKNFKNYIKIILEKKEDIEILKLIKNIVSRTEYKPFSKGFNKNIHESYLIDDTYVPIQLWQDIYKELKTIIPNIKLKNDSFLYMNIKKEDVTEYAETLVLPEKYNIFKDEYFYQLESVFRALLFKQARIEISTGGGKTMVTYLYCRYLIDNYLKPEQKILIIINRKDLVLQTAKAFDEFDTFNDKPLIVESIFAGAKKVINANIIIGTYQSLKNYEKEYFDDFSVIICDEAQAAKAYSIRNDIYSKCFNAEFLFGMTGTYPDYNTLDYLSIVSMFGANVFTKSTKELIDDGNICPVFINKIKINYTEENKHFSENLIASGIIGAEKYRIEKVFFQNYEPRTKLITKLIKGFENNHLILVESVAYCEFLKEFIQKECPDKYVDIIHGNIKDRESIKENMENLTNMVLIATYETMSTGVSINNIHHVHFPNGGRSKFRVKQGTGRGVRLHLLKEFLNVFDYQDNMPRCAFKNHSKERNRIYEDEKHPSKEFNVTI
jgi:superfamily II DNA or RNA helicase